MEINNWNEIAKYLSGNASPAESAAFEEWMQASSEHRQAYEEAKLIWDAEFLHKAHVPTGQDTAAWQDLARQLPGAEESKPTVSIQPWWRSRPLAAAAALVFLAITAYAFWPTLNQDMPERSAGIESADTVQTTTKSWEVALVAQDSVDVFVLPDHSLVWLKKGSSLRYTQAFGKEQRHVVMEGEAFFDVKRDTLHPFVIQTGVVETRVLGTQFQVSAKDNGDVSVEVESGKVSVQLATDLTAEPAILTAGDAVMYKAAEATLKPYDMVAMPMQGSSKTSSPAQQSTKKTHWRHQKAPSTVAERLRPERFIDIEPYWKLNTVRLTVVEGKITNTATKTSYEDLVLLIQHTSEKNGKVVQKKIALNGVIRPGESVEFKKSMMIDWFRNPAEVKISLINARATEEVLE